MTRIGEHRGRKPLITRERLLSLVQAHDGNVAHMAAAAGMSRAGIYKALERESLDTRAFLTRKGKISMLLNDREIKSIVAVDGMIDPFIDHQVRIIDDKPCISYGLSSCGYDIRLGKSFTRVDLLSDNGTEERILDPHTHDATLWEFVDDISGAIELAPGEHILGVSMERFRMPRDVVGICVGKSTYARCGIIVNVTPLEPGWCGYLTIEIHNAGLHFVKVYPGEGIAQVLFHRIDDPAVSYDQRGGKYQDQPAAPVTPRM